MKKKTVPPEGEIKVVFIDVGDGEPPRGLALLRHPGWIAPVIENDIFLSPGFGRVEAGQHNDRYRHEKQKRQVHLHLHVLLQVQRLLVQGSVWGDVTGVSLYGRKEMEQELHAEEKENQKTREFEIVSICNVEAQMPDGRAWFEMCTMRELQPDAR